MGGAQPGTDAQGRPTAALPFGDLIRISAYWLGLTAIDAAVGLFVQFRTNYGDFVPAGEVGRAQAFIAVGAAAIGILIQPTVGSISDYTVSRWGRRKPFIVFGSLLDLLFLFGIAQSNSIIALAAFVMLLAFSTNIARGPFQGYVPDLVPGGQVGVASALVGLMQILGNVTGFALASLADRLHALPVALAAIALVELVTMVAVVVRVGNGQPPKPREGRSWLAIARGTWATDILRERSYIWLVASRLFFLMGGGLLVNLVVTYLKQVHHLSEDSASETTLVLLGLVAAANVLIIVPAARLSDRIGRKPVIYVSCAFGAIGVAMAAFAPTVPVALAGGFVFGASAGSFLAVDWALMTDIIPKAAAGRYMGLSNVATGSATLFSIATGGIVIDFVNSIAGTGTGPRAAYLLGIGYYVIASLMLRPVQEPSRVTARPAEAPAG